MDCETFQNSEIDALYGELDAAASAAMAEHAATCTTCAARFERLRGTRARVLAVAVEGVPTDFESRIMSAVDAGLVNRVPAGATATATASPSTDAPVPFEQLPSQLASQRAAASGGTKPEGGAKIFQFMARPSFAVAATFVLVLGAAAVLMTKGSMKAAPMAANQEGAPAARAAESDNASAASAVAMATAAAPMVAAPPPPGAPGAPDEATGMIARNEPAAPPAAAPTMAAFAAAKAGAASKPALSDADDRAFSSAKAMAAAGRCAEALPKLEALKSSVPEAELYAARCIAKTRGCAAAAPRFDAAAQSNAGTEIGSRATLEGAKCYEATGDLAEARKRLVAAKDEGVLQAEASRELDALDRATAPAAGGAPHGAGHAAPKAARPAPATPAKK